MRLAKKKHAEEKDDPTVILALDIKKIWKSLEEFSIPSDAWRRVEDFALPSAYRTCTKVKGKMILMDSISSAEAAKLSSVFDEFRTVVQYITSAYMDVSSIIAEDPEQTEKYYEKTCPALLNLWSACVRLTVDCILTLKQHWGETDEYMDLSKAISSTCATCVKMVTVTTDVTKLPVLDTQKDAFLECSVDKSTEVGSALSKLLDATKPNEEGPNDAMMEMITWSLFSLNHVSCFVIQPLLANGHAESNWFKRYSGTLNTMFDKLESVTDESMAGMDSQPHSETPPPKQTEAEPEPEKKEASGQDKKNEPETKGTKKGDVKGKGAAETQEAEPESEGSPPQQQIPEILTTLDQRYTKFSDEVLSTGKVSVCLEDPSDQNVRIFYRPEVHKSLGKCRFGACDMKDRIQWLDEIGISSEQRLVSDIYVIKDGILKTTTAVEVEVTAVPPQGSASQIIVKVKKGGEWSILEDFNREVLPGHVQISFKTNELEAVYAYIEEQSDEEEIVPEGCTFKSPTNSKVFINFPHGAVQDPTKVLVKFVSTEDITEERPTSKDTSSDNFIGILAVSDAVEVSAKDPSVDIQKNILVQLSIEGDDSDDGKDTHLVVIRYRGDQVQVMDKSQCHITKVESGVYSVQTRGLWCVAIARIKKIFLNMRDTVKKEFLVMFGKVALCNICTFIDNALRDRERGLTTFWIEIIEKVKVPEAISEHTNQNLIEIKSSRSKDLTIRQSDTLNIQLDGQVRVIGAPLTDKYTLTYLENTDNHLQVPLEIKRDQDKPPNATFTFKDSTSGQTCHTVSVPIRDLTELATDDITSRPPTKYHDKSNSREELKHRDEAAKNVLSHSSLMCLARAISHTECKRLGTQMGVPSETMQKLWETCEREPTNTNFRILCEWRGKSVRSSMVDFLLNSLRTIGLCSQAAVIEKVAKLGRGVLQEDFNS